MEDAEIDRLAPQSRPAGTVVMRPAWSQLLFLHWAFEPQEVQKLLPDGLAVDNFGGKAYVGLVPFQMSGVRPYFVPGPGRLGRFYQEFHELNVRTYVLKDGVPGVWFFSLDAVSLSAVLMARWWFKLPYFKARMRSRRMRSGKTSYFSRRLWPGPHSASCRVIYSVEGQVAPAPLGSLEHFLIERYVLYSAQNGQLFRGRVHHSPYRIQNAKVDKLEETCLAAAGLNRPNQAPHAVYSNHVQVEVFGLEQC